MVKKSAKKTSDATKIAFKFRPPAGAKTVYLAGDFNNWDKGSLPMTHAKDGEWVIKIDLSPGEFEYKFLVDGVWYNDPNADRYVPNVWGSENSVTAVQ